MAKQIPSAADAAQRWSQGFGAAGARWAAGVEAVTVAPGQLAAAAQNRYLTGVQQSANKWASRVASVSLAQWKTQAVQKGQSRLAGGAQSGMAKYQARIAAVLEAEKSIIAGLPPRGSVEQNIARSSAFQLAMHQQFSGS
jgi:hypothetical protein